MFETSLLELKVIMRKWFITLIAIIMISLNTVSVAAEEPSSYTYKGDTNEEGLYQGQGALYYNDQLLYKGEFANGNFNGEGTLYRVEKGSFKGSNSKDTIKYQGQFKNGLYHGTGTLYFDFSIPEGEASNFRGQQYEGKFHLGQYHGYGTEYNMSGDIKNQGYFIYGKPYKYEGPTDENGKMHGQGKLLDSEGQVMFEGEFVHGEIHGSGTMYLNEERTQKYVGNFVHDQMEGKGTVYIGDDLYYEGQFADGFKQGEGTLYFPDKTISYQGEFINNRTKEQPFQIKSEVHIDSNLNGTYSVYVVLLDKYNTESTLNHFNNMKETVKDTFDDIKDVSKKSDYQGFIATKDMGNILDSDFQDDFLGFQTTAIKTKMMFINQYEIFSRQTFTFDPNLMNVSHEIFLPENSRGIKVNGQAQQMDSEYHYVWMDIQGDEYIASQFQLYNPFTIGATVVFVIVLVGGMIYFRKKDKKKKAQ